MNHRILSYRRAYWLLAGIYALLFLLLFSPWDGGGFDEVFYYSYLSSTFFDGDVDVLNDYYQSNNDFEAIRYACSLLGRKGMVVNQFAAGSAILWSPLYIPLRGAACCAGLLWAEPPQWINDRYSPPYLMAISLGTLVFGFLALLIIYAICALEYEPRVALCAAVGAVAALPLTVYVFHHSDMAHAQSAFATALLLYVSLRHRRFSSPAAYAIIAAALALATLVRWQNILFGLIPAAFWVERFARQDRRLPSRSDWLAVAVAGLVFLALLAPQLCYWHAQQGDFLTMPQGPGFMKWKSPNFWNVLFSGWNGLYYWHPLMLLASVGLVIRLFSRRDKVLGVTAFLCVVLLVYVNASVFDWFAGYSFGARRFCSAVPVLALGLAAFYDRFRGRLAFMPAALTGVAVLANLLLHLAFTRDVTEPFYLSTFWSLRSDLLSLLPDWIRGLHLNSQVSVYFLAGHPIKAVLLLLAGLALIGGTLTMVLKGGFGFLERNAKEAIAGLGIILLTASVILLAFSPARNNRGILFSRVLSAGAKMIGEEKRKVTSLLIQSRYANPLLYWYAVETLEQRDFLFTHLDAVYEFSPEAWAKWIESLDPNEVGEYLKRKGPESERPEFLFAATFYLDKIQEARERKPDEEPQWLKRFLRFNPFDKTALLRSAEVAASRGNTAEAAELRARLQRFLEANVESFFRFEKRFEPYQATVFQGFYRSPTMDLAQFYEGTDQLERAATLYGNAARLAPGDAEIDRRRQAVKARRKERADSSPPKQER